MRSTAWAGDAEQVAAARRAEQRICEATSRGFFACLVGLVAPQRTIRFHRDRLAVQPLTEPPEPLNCILNTNRGDIGAITSVPHDQLTHELWISDELVDSIEDASAYGSLVSRILRMKTQSPLYIPAVTSCSWDTLAGQEEGSTRAKGVDPFPASGLREFAESRSFDDKDAQWISNNFGTMISMLGRDDRYRFALDCLNMADFDQDYRMSATRIWGGIEALFDVSQEIRFRLSALIATVVAPPGRIRVEEFEKLKKLYDSRSKIVHGRNIKAGVLASHVWAARKVLCDCLLGFTEIGAVPTVRDLEVALISQESVPLKER